MKKDGTYFIGMCNKCPWRSREYRNKEFARADGKRHHHTLGRGHSPVVVWRYYSSGRLCGVKPI